MEIEVVVESTIPSGDKQWNRKVHITSDSSVGFLLNKLCEDTEVCVSSNHVLLNDQNKVLDRTKSLHDCDIVSGSVLRWTDESVETKDSTCFNTWWFMCFIALFIGVVGLVAVAVIKSQTGKPAYGYGIVFDAGSTHTSMYIYRWAGTKTNKTAIASQYTDVVAPHVALASLTDQPERAGEVIKECLDKAKERIPSENFKTTPVYLGATAGMRLLHERNSSASEMILNVVRNAIAKYPFKFNHSDARIISGSEEGTFSWITSNYISGVFHVSPPSKIIEDVKKQETFGALDLGGASAQITFVPRNTTIPANYRFDVHLYGHEHRVYTHSFLCYGVNQALRRLRAELVREQNFSSTILNPCLPKGYNTTVWKHKDIFDSWCVSGFPGEQAFGSVIIPSEDVDQNTTYIFKGESDAEKCEALIDKHLFNFTDCSYSSCSFNNQFQPTVNGKFYAFSSFFYVTSFLNLTDGTTQFSMQDFQKTVSAFCNMTWAEVKQMVAVQNSSKPFYCFQATFMNLLLTKGYKFNSTSWKNLDFVGKVAGTQVGWSLGFILAESLDIPEQTTEELLTVLTFSLLVTLFLIFILVAFGFAIHARKYQRLKRSSHYQKLTEYGSL